VAESLWHGAPVITLRGQRMASRYGASLLTAAGCSEMIADSRLLYAAIAKDLAKNDGTRWRLRRDLRTMMRQHGLTDSVGMARRLGAGEPHMGKQNTRLRVVCA